MERLSSEDIRDIHDYMLLRYGGLAGEYESGLIDYMADKPFDGFGDTEFYPNLFQKAAVYMEGFATHQYFCDGNKRTAYMCAKIFLELNEYILDITDDDLYETAIAVAKKEIGLEELTSWLMINSNLKI